MKLIRIPARPASPKNSAYTDQQNAAITPTEMRVSIVAARWRALVSAARWNGQAPHTATGAASASDSHCQLRNCSTGAIASTTTGTASASETSSRCRSAAVSSAAASSTALPGAAAAGGGAGRAAVYPACVTTEIRSSGLTAAGKLTRAFSVAKFTVAVTPSSLFSFFSIRAAHEAQVIPPIDSSTLPTGPAATSGLRMVPVLNGNVPPARTR